MSKGKEHKKYEFGAKASVVVGKNNGVILGACSLPKNDYDGQALEPTLAQVEMVSGYRPAVAIGDKGFRGKTHCGTTEIVTTNRAKKNATAYEKRKAKARFRRRAAIEPRIGHLIPTSLGNATFEGFVVARASRLPSNDLPTQARRPRYIQKSKSKLLLV